MHHSFNLPSENVALDEVLLNGVNDGHTEATLRIWESPVPFVVVGTGQAVSDVAHVGHCETDGVPILRRCSAGGCVLQGAGSLNFALALDLRGHPQLKNLHDSYCWVLGRLSEALGSLGVSTRHEGICDLTINGRKISGNAQRRRRSAILHHGTLLYSFDTAAMSRYLPEPEDRPDYRGKRSHEDFLAQLSLGRDALSNAIVSAFNAGLDSCTPTPWELDETATLARTKYEDPAWNFRR